MGACSSLHSHSRRVAASYSSLAPRTKWGSLTIVLLTIVFAFLPVKDVLARCRLVCKQWASSRAGWNMLWLKRITREQNKVEQVLHACEFALVRTVKLDSGWLPGDEEVLSALADLPHLQTLDLSNYCRRVANEGLTYVSVLPSLTKLDLTSCNITGEGLQLLTRLRKLQDLDLSWCPIMDEDLRHLPALRSLQRLCLRSYHGFTAMGLKHVSNIPSLRELVLHNTKVTDEGLSHVVKLSELTHLDLTCCKSVTDEGLGHVGAMVSLRTLKLGGCPQITDEGVRHLCGLILLDKLILHATLVTETGLEHLSALSKLQIEC